MKGIEAVKKIVCYNLILRIGMTTYISFLIASGL
jgi:hypothetical protein